MVLYEKFTEYVGKEFAMTVYRKTTFCKSYKLRDTANFSET